MIQRIVVGSILIVAPVAAATCESLTTLKLANTTITVVQIVDAGAFTPPDVPPTAAALAVYKPLPAFCRTI